MSELTFENKTENKRGWLLPLMIVVLVTAVVIAALALSGVLGVFSTTSNTENSPETPHALWESQGIESYQYTLQVGCFCMTDLTQPVIIDVQNGEVASITYAADGSAADPELFERYNSIGKLFTVIDEAEAQDPALLDVTYDETYGVPLSVNIDISEMMADEELYLTVSDFQPVQ